MNDGAANGTIKDRFTITREMEATGAHAVMEAAKAGRNPIEIAIAAYAMMEATRRGAKTDTCVRVLCSHKLEGKGKCDGDCESVVEIEIPAIH